MSAPLLAQALAGDVFFAFISAVAFATILAVVAGLTISASTSFAHDFYTNVIHHGKERSPGEEVRVARWTALVVGAVSIAIAIGLGPGANVAFLVGLAFAVAAHLEPEILIVDEVLAVGDARFQKKCLGRMKEAVEEARTLFFVSHNIAAVEGLCSRTLLLNEGVVIAYGEPSQLTRDDVIDSR